MGALTRDLAILRSVAYTAENSVQRIERLRKWEAIAEARDVLKAATESLDVLDPRLDGAVYCLRSQVYAAVDDTARWANNAPFSGRSILAISLAGVSAEADAIIQQAEEFYGHRS